MIKAAWNTTTQAWDIAVSLGNSAYGYSVQPSHVDAFFRDVLARLVL